MTKELAEKLGSYVLDSGLDASILTLGRGDEFCVRIVGSECWHLWSFDDWNAFAAEQKKVRKRERKREDRAMIGIDPQEQYRLALFA